MQSKMNFGNHALILSELAKLEFTDDETTLRKIANIFISRTKYKEELIASASEILSKLSEVTQPRLNQQNFMKQFTFSLLAQLDTHFEEIEYGQITVSHSLTFIKFIKELHARSAIDRKSVANIYNHIVNAGKKNNKSRLKNFFDTFKDEFLNSYSEKDRNFIENAPEHVPSAEKAPIVAKVSEKAEATKPSINTTSNNFSALLFNLETLDIEDFMSIVGKFKIKTSREMKMLAKEFHEFLMKTKLSQVYAQLAEMIDNNLTSGSNDESFKKYLLEVHQAQMSNYLNVTNQDKNAMQRQDEKEFVKITGELYKLNWFERDRLIELIDLIAKNGFASFHQLELLINLLQIISLTLVKNGESELCSKYRDILVQSKEVFKSGKSHLTCLRLIKNLEDIIALSVDSTANNNSATANEQNEMNSLLSNMNKDNIVETADKLSQFITKNSRELDLFTKSLIAKVVRSEDEAVLCAKLSVEIQKTIESSDEFKEMLVDSCQQTLLNNLSLNISGDQLPEMISFIRFVAELHQFKVLHNNFISLCIELLLDDGSDSAADCLTLLLMRTGPVLDFEDSANLDKVFDKLKEASSVSGTYRAASYRKLINFRDNNWILPKKESSSIKNFDGENLENILMQIADEYYLVSYTSRKCINQSEEKLNEFINALWTCVLKNSESGSAYAKLCTDLSTTGASKDIQVGSRFRDCLVDFLNCRILTFDSLTSNDYTEKVETRLASVMLFIAGLYVKEMVTDEELGKLLKPSKSLSFDALSKLTSILTPKITATRNVRSMALLMNLEDLAQTQSKGIWKKLKDDIGEITEIVAELHLKREAEDQ